MENRTLNEIITDGVVVLMNEYDMTKSNLAERIGSVNGNLWNIIEAEQGWTLYFLEVTCKALAIALDDLIRVGRTRAMIRKPPTINYLRIS